MLGFSPEVSTFSNLEHGRRLCASAPSELVPVLEQVSGWWQDPNCAYAFESRMGAEWWSRHGGPSEFLGMLSKRLPYLPRRASPPALCEKPLCYVCNNPLADDMCTVTEYVVYRCLCAPRYTHVGCTYADKCPLCQTRVKKLEKKGELIDEM